jgi:hypothetical protein
MSLGIICDLFNDAVSTDDYTTSTISGEGRCWPISKHCLGSCDGGLGWTVPKWDDGASWYKLHGPCGPEGGPTMFHMLFSLYVIPLLCNWQSVFRFSVQILKILSRSDIAAWPEKFFSSGFEPDIGRPADTPWKTLIKTARLLAQIWTQDLLNTNESAKHSAAIFGN